MIIFHSDLDNTLIYSYKRDIGQEKKCVELYDGREVSFMTEKSLQLLERIQEKVLVVPTTTRTVEQYQRIRLGIGVPEYALTCNGGVLLVEGWRDEKWYCQSRALVEPCRAEMIKAVNILEKDEDRSMEVRFIEELFVFTKSEKPQHTMEKLREELNTEKLDIFQNGIKVYAVPKALSKGNAVKRLRKKLNPEYVIAAGDSEFDVSMLREADAAVVPENLAEKFFMKEGCKVIGAGKIYSDAMLEYILESHLR